MPKGRLPFSPTGYPVDPIAFKLAWLGDVDVSSSPPAAGDTLVWVDADKKWKPGSGGGGSPIWIPSDGIGPDVFTITGPTDTTHTLTYLPLGVNAVFLNGLVLQEGADYTLDYATGDVTVSATLVAGDLLIAHYVTPGQITGRRAWLTDTFTRADASTLGDAESGQPWTATIGGFGVVSDKAQANSFGGAGTAVALADAYLNDGRFKATIHTAPSNADTTLILRGDAAGTNLLQVQFYTPLNRLALFITRSSVDSALYTDPGFSAAGSTTYAVTAVALGRNISVSVNGVPRFTYTLSTSDYNLLLPNTYAGIRAASSDSTSTFDDITVRPL